MWTLIAAGVGIALFYLDAKVTEGLSKPDLARSDNSEQRKDP